MGSVMQQDPSMQQRRPMEHQQQLNSYGEYQQGSIMKPVDNYNGNGRSPRPGPRTQRSSPQNGRGTGYPLRILVPSELVGAIIGRKGQTIRNITTQSRARVDVHRTDNSGLLEKVISIYGQPENCTNACKEIMKVMQNELVSQNRGEVFLKMLTDDRYCGRIIGKEGKVIKKIREDTDTRITVSNVQDVAAMYPDRVITIKGSIDSMAGGEAAISNILRECYDKEAQMAMNQGYYGQQQMHQQMPMQQSPMYGGGNQGQGHSPPMHQQSPLPPQVLELCQIKVPNSAVGAIIGARGSNIKQVSSDSNASVTIEPKKDEDPNPAADRLVTIKGSQDSQWRACYFIFEKLRQEGFSGNDDIRLCTIIYIPRVSVGRVIGKGGKNVRDIQRMTGAMLKLPEDQASQSEEVPVEIFGNFTATQNAMSCTRAFVCQGPQMEMMGNGMGNAAAQRRRPPPREQGNGNGYQQQQQPQQQPREQYPRENYSSPRENYQN